MKQVLRSIYEQAWLQMDRPTQQVWLSLLFTPHNGAALPSLQIWSGLEAQALHAALDQLLRLNLVEHLGHDEEMRLRLHSSARDFLQAKALEQRQSPLDQDNIFQKILFQSIEDITNRVQRAGDTVTGEEGEQILQILEYALSWPSLWSATQTLLLAAAPKMRDVSYRAAWAECIERGIIQSQLYGDTHIEATLLFQLGLLQQLQAHYKAAQTSLTKSAKLYRDVGDNRDSAAAINRLAFIACRQRQYSIAKELVNTARLLLSEDDVELDVNYFVRGSIALDEGDGALAEQYYRQGLAICQRMEDKPRIAQRCWNVGLALLKEKKYTEAIAYFDHALDLYKKIDDPRNQAILLTNKGAALIEMGQPEQALPWLQKAYLVLHEVQDPLNIAKVAVNLGIAHRMLQRWGEAERFLQSAIQQWVDLGNIKSEINARVELASVYIGQVQDAKAVAELEAAKQLLPQIQDDPAHPALASEVSKHLMEVQAGSSSSHER